jgi:hypothetical protein
MKVPFAPESTRGRVLIGSFFSGVIIIASMWKELLFSDLCVEKIYIEGADVEAVLHFKNPNHTSHLLLPRSSFLLHSSRQ